MIEWGVNPADCALMVTVCGIALAGLWAFGKALGLFPCDML